MEGVLCQLAAFVNHPLQNDEASLNYLEHNVALLVLSLVVHHAGTIDEEDTLHQGDILPDLGLARHRCRLTHLGRAHNQRISMLFK